LKLLLFIFFIELNYKFSILLMDYRSDSKLFKDLTLAPYLGPMRSEVEIPEFDLDDNVKNIVP